MSDRRDLLGRRDRGVVVEGGGAVAASGVAARPGLHIGMNAVIDLADRTAGVDRAVVGAEAARYAGLRSSLGDDLSVGEEDRVVGIVIAARVRCGHGTVAGINL